MNSTDVIRERLFALKDERYGDFTARLIPTIERAAVIGVRSPALKQLGRELKGSAHAAAFLDVLPHTYLEEYTLHALLLSYEKDFCRCVNEVERLLPYVDNWAVCDSLSPAVFRKESERLLPYIERWIDSEHPYTVRYAIGCLMRYFLDERFDTRYLDMASAVRSDDYYVNMMTAWYFATALFKQYDAALPYLTGYRLDFWTHNMTIQKAVESNRILSERKTYLKTLRRKRSDA